MTGEPVLWQAVPIQWTNHREGPGFHGGGASKWDMKEALLIHVLCNVGSTLSQATTTSFTDKYKIRDNASSDDCVNNQNNVSYFADTCTCTYAKLIQLVASYINCNVSYALLI